VTAAGRDHRTLDAVYAGEPGTSTQPPDLTDEAPVTALGKRLGTAGHVVFQCLRPGSRQRLAARIPPAIPAAMTPCPCCVHASAARHSKRPGHTAAPWAPSAPWNTR
jgi:hypothetical protein